MDTQDLNVDLNESESQSRSAQTEIEHEENSWSHSRNQFNFKSKKGDSFVMQCKLCLPKNVRQPYIKLCFQPAQSCTDKFIDCSHCISNSSMVIASSFVDASSQGIGSKLFVLCKPCWSSKHQLASFACFSLSYSHTRGITILAWFMLHLFDLRSERFNYMGV